MNLEDAMVAARDLFRESGKPVGIYVPGEFPDLDSDKFYASPQDVDATSDHLVVVCTAYE